MGEARPSRCSAPSSAPSPGPSPGLRPPHLDRRSLMAARSSHHGDRAQGREPGLRWEPPIRPGRAPWVTLPGLPQHGASHPFSEGLPGDPNLT